MTDEIPGTKLSVPIPSGLSAVLGYTGPARYVGFCWSPSGDELTYSDGVASGSAQSWSYLSFKRHPAVAKHLQPFDLGSSEQDAKHVLIVDGDTNTASVAPIAEARAFLADQHPPQEPLTPEEQEALEREFSKLLEEMRNQPVDYEAMAQRMKDQRNRLAVMLAFLDQQVPPGQGPTPPV